MHGQRSNKQQRSRVSSREDDHPVCMGEGWGTGRGSGGQEATVLFGDRLPQTDKDEVFPEKASWLLSVFATWYLWGYSTNLSPHEVRHWTWPVLLAQPLAPCLWCGQSYMHCWKREYQWHYNREYSSWSITWATWILTNILLDWTSLEESKDVSQRHLVKAPQRHPGFI